MEGQGRIQCVLIATAGSNIVYERFYERFTDIEKADIRHCFERSQKQLTQSSTECIGRCRSVKCLKNVPYNDVHNTQAWTVSTVNALWIAGRLQLWPTHKATLCTMQQAQESTMSLHVSLTFPPYSVQGSFHAVSMSKLSRLNDKSCLLNDILVLCELTDKTLLPQAHRPLLGMCTRGALTGPLELYAVQWQRSSDSWCLDCMMS